MAMKKAKRKASSQLAGDALLLDARPQVLQAVLDPSVDSPLREMKSGGDLWRSEVAGRRQVQDTTYRRYGVPGVKA